MSSSDPPVGHAARSWEGRPLTARLLRTTVFGAPILAAILLTRLVVVALPHPNTVPQKLGWWTLVVVTSVSTGAVVDRWSRRLLPVAALMKLSLVFPDEAPSRFKVAMRRHTVRDLERRLRDDALDPSTTPNDSAEILVEMAAQLNGHDRNTRGHTERVRAYSLMIGEELGLSQAELNKLHWAALVHDVGKLRVPAKILNKPGKPDEEEWNILKRHPEWGDEMVRPLRPWLGNFADATGQHHERWDGNGYPRGLKGNGITLAARIVSVADAYDVMTSVRSYKTAMDPTEARMELTRCAGTQFDPRCARALISASLGASVKTKKGIVWAIRAPILTLTARSNLFSTAATTTAAVAATAAVVATTVPPPAPDPLPFVDDAVVVEEIDFVTAVDQVFVFPGETALVDVVVNDQLASGQFGSPDLIARVIEADGKLPGIEVATVDGLVTVSAEADAIGTVDVPIEVCANERSCRESSLVVSVVRPSDRNPMMPIPSIRAPVGERYGPHPVASSADSGVEIVGYAVEVGESPFFATAPSIDDSGQLQFVAGGIPGLVILRVDLQTTVGPADPVYLPILIEPES